MGSIARVISWVFHPLFVPVYAFLLIYFRDPYLNTFFPRKLFAFFIFMMSINIVAPAVSILIMKKKGVISSIEVDERKERLFPILLVIFYYLLSFFLLRYKQFPIPSPIYSMLLGMIVSLIVALLITTIWKISMHMLAIGGVLGALVGIFRNYQYEDMPIVYMLIFILGLVGFARLYNKNHDLGQIYAGALLGYLINFTVLSSGIDWSY